LRIAQVIFGVGVVDAVRQRRFVTASGPDALAFFTDDDRRAGVLTGRQNAFRRDIGVTQELQGNVFIVFAGLRVAQDIGNLLLMRGRSINEASWKACCASSVSACGSTLRISCPSNSETET
jgi:hypothetical protein